MMFPRRFRAYQDIDAETGILPDEPELVRGRMGCLEGLAIVVMVEWVLLALQILVSIIVCAEMDVFTGLLTICIIAVGIWAISRLSQGRREEDGRLLTPYCAWKSVLVVFEIFGMIILVIVLSGLDANSGMKASIIFTMISNSIFIGIGIWFLTFVTKCRAYFQIKDQITNPVRGDGTQVVYNPSYIYGQFYQESSPGGAVPAPPGYAQAVPAESPAAPPVYKEKEDNNGTEMTVRRAARVTDDDL